MNSCLGQQSNWKGRSEGDDVARQRDNVAILGTFRSNDFSVSLSDYRQGLLQKWHSHEEPVLILLLAGYTREQVRGRDMIASPLDVGVKPAGIRHQDHFWPNGVRALRVILSESLLSELETTSRVMERWEWLRGSDAVQPLLRTVKALRAKSGHAEIEESLHESVAAMLTTTNGMKPADAPPWLCHAREHLETSYSSGVRLRQLANQAKVHPVYFARMFRRFFGCSVGQHVRRIQLRAAAALLANGRYSLAEIACQSEFSDQAHMTRAFTKAYEITPGEFRRLID